MSHLTSVEGVDVPAMEICSTRNVFVDNNSDFGGTLYFSKIY
jgi:hypothetical protein